MGILTTTIATSLVITIAIFLALRTLLAKDYGGIPGPKRHFLQDNSRQLGLKPWEQFRQWAFKYGELFHIKLGMEHFVYVNSREAVKGIFDKQSAKTSFKGPFMGEVAIVHGQRMAIMPYGPKWRTMRSITHKVLTAKSALMYVPSQEFEATQLLYDLLHNNLDHKQFYSHVQRYATSVILTSVYGIRISSKDDERVRAICSIMKEFSETTAPGAFITSRLPWLTYLPVWLKWWRTRALKYYFHQREIWMQLLDELKSKISQGKAPGCFTKDTLIDDSSMKECNEEQLAFLSGTMIEAGSETTSAAINTAILYLASNPSIQVLAQQEIDEHVPSHRSPSFADSSSLPFIHALIKGIFRIRPLTRFGTPHYTRSPISYKNTVIPANTYLVINQPALHFDPAYFNSPEKFNLERYLGFQENSMWYASRADPTERDQYTFGAGRRISPGTHLAENSIFVVLSKILWAFDIRPRLENGKEDTEVSVEIDDDSFETGANTIPKPFEARFLPRSLEREGVIRREWDKAQDNGYETRGSRVDLAGIVVDY